jgi:hypothetical protein
MFTIIVSDATIPQIPLSLFMQVCFARPLFSQLRSDPTRFLNPVQPELDVQDNERPEPVFVNVYGAQESIPTKSIPPAYVAWRAGTITLFLLGP